MVRFKKERKGTFAPMYFYIDGVANRTVVRAKDLFVEYISEKGYSMLPGGSISNSCVVVLQSPYETIQAIRTSDH